MFRLLNSIKLPQINDDNLKSLLLFWVFLSSKYNLRYIFTQMSSKSYKSKCKQCKITVFFCYILLFLIRKQEVLTLGWAFKWCWVIKEFLVLFLFWAAKKAINIYTQLINSQKQNVYWESSLEEYEIFILFLNVLTFVFVILGSLEKKLNWKKYYLVFYVFLSCCFFLVSLFT